MRAIFGTLAGLGLLIGVTPASAQQGGFTGSSGSSGGTFSGSSGGTFSGSSGGTFSGSSGGTFSGSSGGTFSGSSGGTFSGSSGGFTGTSTGTTGGRTTGGTGSTKYGTTSFMGAHYGNPLAMGATASGSGAGARSTGTGTSGAYATTNYPSSSSTFGQPVYTVPNTAAVSRTGNLGTGTTLGGQGTTGMGTGAGGTAQTFRGATSAGIRPRPQYYAEPVFERVAPRATVAVMRPDLQEMLSSSTRLRSGGRIQVTTQNDKVILRGNVGTERERRIAEAMIKMTPGVREVSNELISDKKP